MTQILGMSRGRLIVISGPSCAGKTPLWKTLGQRHPSLAKTLKPAMVYTARPPRPGEKDGEDYYFRDHSTLASFRDQEHMIVCKVRRTLQAIDLHELQDELEESDLVYEGNPVLGRSLLQDERLQKVDRLGIFVSPLGLTELLELAQRGGDEPRASVTRLMRRRLMRRAMRKYDMLELPNLQDIEQRASTAYDELLMAPSFDHVIVNYDGEDSDHWDLTGIVLGSARRAVDDFASLVRGEAPSAGVEAWPEGALPAGDDDSTR